MIMDQKLFDILLLTTVIFIFELIYCDYILTGVTFTNKQIKMNEHICMKIIDIDESGQWLGSLAIGKERKY